MTPTLLRWLCAATMALPLFCLAAAAETGVSPNEVRIAMVNAQSGPAAGLGVAVLAGAMAYFKHINSIGGVHGRQITLLVKDDGYEPERTMALTQQLIEHDQIFALFGYVGTPTSRAVVPMVMRAKIPYLFPFTGAESMRQPVKPWVFNLRASYLNETEAMVAALSQGPGLKNIALLMQDDSFGESVKSGVNGALSKRGLHIAAEARIQRNSLDVAAAVNALQAAKPEAIIFVGTYQQLSAAIRQAKVIGLHTRFMTVSFIGTKPFIALAGADAEGVYITQVMPSPEDPILPLAQQFLADIPPSAIGHTAFESYLAAAIFVRALEQAGPQPTRAKLAEALNALNADFGGFPVAFSPSDHQGSKAVFLTRVENGQAVPVTQIAATPVPASPSQP